MARICLVTSYSQSAVNFRSELIRELVSLGHDIYVLAPDHSVATRNALAALGAKTVHYPLERSGMSLTADIRSFLSLFFHFSRYRYDVILSYFLKPNIWGIFAASLARIPRRICMVEGLGYAFTSIGTTPISGKSLLRKRLLKRAISCLYAASFRLSHHIIILNNDDLLELSDKCRLPKQRVLVLGGIGVDLSIWRPTYSYPQDVTFLMVARLLREKGVFEFLQAAEMLKRDFPNASFILLGDVDQNPGSISVSDIMPWTTSGIIDYRGHVDDILSQLQSSSVFVLPSYREGVPRSSQEALSVGLPVITTDVPGCRETVVHGQNGFLVPPFDPIALYRAMATFLHDPSTIYSMGLNSRSLAETRFDVHAKTKSILDFAFYDL